MVHGLVINALGTVIGCLGTLTAAAARLQRPIEGMNKWYSAEREFGTICVHAAAVAVRRRVLLNVTECHRSLEKRLTAIPATVSHRPVFGLSGL